MLILALKDHYQKINNVNKRGFTLLEMLTVLFIIGLAASLALPNLSLVFDRIKFSNEQKSAYRSINLLSYKALSQNKDFVLFNDTKESLNNQELGLYNSAMLSKVSVELPTGWSLSVEKPIFYKSSGFCSGGSILLSVGKYSYPLKLNPPYCQIQK